MLSVKFCVAWLESIATLVKYCYFIDYFVDW